MTIPINLNQFRKAKTKAEEEKTAAQNRAKFGQTKAQKQAEKRNAEKTKSLLDGHKRDGDE